ncbi:MAG TPA: hypothetical protein VL354_09065 [Spirochaetia bacterium]|nr:hypothetical protein [Spirochaetia bacterium]
MMGPDKEHVVRYRKVMQTLVPRYVPAGKSIDRLLDELADKWNPLFDSQQRKNLVEDVNALVRDFLRPLRRSFLATPPDSSRIHGIAEQLSASKNLTKISKKDSLIRYLELYVVRCLDATK